VCPDDENGVDSGGRVGYDASAGRLTIGGFVDVSTTDIRDSVSAFSTTPAYYAFTREVNIVFGLGGRVGAGSERFLVYGTGDRSLHPRQPQGTDLQPSDALRFQAVRFASTTASEALTTTGTVPGSTASLRAPSVRIKCCVNPQQASRLRLLAALE
jgi:hypothetical protein